MVFSPGGGAAAGHPESEPMSLLAAGPLGRPGGWCHPEKGGQRGWSGRRPEARDLEL